MSRIRSVAVATATAVLVAFSQQAMAQHAQPEDAPIIVYPRQAAAQGAASALLQKAQRQGQVRVIVGLDVPLQYEDDLTAAEGAAQVRRLESVQNAVAFRSVISTNQVVRFETIPFMSVFVTQAQLQRLLADPQVTSVQEDGPFLQLMLADSVPLIRAPALWNQGFTGANRVVAVLDTGTQYSHPMIGNAKVAAGLCRSTTQSGQTSSTCPGGAPSSNALASGQNCTGAAGCDHGTHVATIAVGNSRGLKGVARGARLISGKVFSLCPSCSQGTTAFFTDVNSGLERVFQLRGSISGIASINMSLGTGSVFSSACDSLLPATAEIINKLYRAKISTVIATGNGGSNSGISAPACIAKAIAVGSTNKNDTISSFSNHHALVDVMAPGGSINAGVLGGGLGVKSGTSMASPHVAGAVALLQHAHPGSTVAKITKALKKSKKKVTRNGVTKPRIDLPAASKGL